MNMRLLVTHSVNCTAPRCTYYVRKHNYANTIDFRGDQNCRLQNKQSSADVQRDRYTTIRKTESGDSKETVQ